MILKYLGIYQRLENNFSRARTLLKLIQAPTLMQATLVYYSPVVSDTLCQ